ncbi:MAG: lysine--tRNA ligase, partial [Dehalococcoidia bacterium]|nr:lysine--tRNA ligase [Dehalococcoidia bacterium]
MASRLDKIAQQRRQKLERIRARGIEPYPYGYERTHTTDQAIELLKKQEKKTPAKTKVIRIAGRITANRPMGKISFLDLRDGEGRIQ